MKNKPSPYQHIGIIGLGAMGGALAKTIMTHHPNTDIYAITQDQQDIEKGIKLGLIKAGETTISTLPSNTELVFICTPIQDIVSTIQALTDQFHNGLTITDIGSIKSFQIPKLSDAHVYIGGHPMAGAEKGGLDHHESVPLYQASYVLVPANKPEYTRFKSYIKSLSFHLIEQSAKDHDKSVAYTSHLPYLMASFTTHVVSQLGETESAMIQALIAGGFKDTTRVASTSEKWGRDILEHNKDNIQNALSQVKEIINQFDAWITSENWDAIEAALKKIREQRQKILTP